MRLPYIPSEIVLVLVMRIVDVAVCVFHRLMRMFVSMVLGQIQPDHHAHKAGASQKLAIADSFNSRMETAAPMNGAVEK